MHSQQRFHWNDIIGNYRTNWPTVHCLHIVYVLLRTDRAFVHKRGQSARVFAAIKCTRGNFMSLRSTKYPSTEISGYYTTLLRWIHSIRVHIEAVIWKYTVYNHILITEGSKYSRLRSHFKWIRSYLFKMQTWQLPLFAMSLTLQLGPSRSNLLERHKSRLVSERIAHIKICKNPRGHFGEAVKPVSSTD